MPGISITDNYDSLLSTTLRNVSSTLFDQISEKNAFYYKIKQNGAYKTVDTLGYEFLIPLMYELNRGDSYAGYDTLGRAPYEGITVSRWQWKLYANHVTISGEEEELNKGETQVLNLLKAKTKQSTLGCVLDFNKRFLQGNGENVATQIETAYTSPVTGATFLEPLAKLVDSAPSGAGTVGGIDQAANTWWRNQIFDSAATANTAFLHELRKLRNDCDIAGPGGEPDLHIADPNVYLTYMRALSLAHQNPSYQKADIPFDNVAFFGQPVVQDKFLPDFKNGTAANVPVASAGTWVMLHTPSFEMRVNSSRNFASGPFMKPVDQDAKLAQILWMGGVGLNQRRKHGVIFDINTTTLDASAT